MKSLFCLNPTKEPKATDHIDGMIKMIEKLINKNAAYEKVGMFIFQFLLLKIMEIFQIKI